MSLSFRPGMTGATATPIRMPAAASRPMVSKRWAGEATLGSMARAARSSAKGMLTYTVTSASRARADEHVHVAPDQRALGDDADRVAEVAADLEAAPRQPVDRLDRLVAVGHAGEDDRVALPRLCARARGAAARGALTFATILRSKSVPAPQPRYWCVGRA